MCWIKSGLVGFLVGGFVMGGGVERGRELEKRVTEGEIHLR